MNEPAAMGMSLRELLEAVKRWPEDRRREFHDLTRALSATGEVLQAAHQAFTIVSQSNQPPGYNEVKPA